MKIDEFVIQSILQMNGVSESEQDNYLNPSYDSIADTYSHFNDINRAVERVKKSVKMEEPILIWGDFDVDGLTATSIMYRTLSFLGANVAWHIPDRVTEGHGLNRKDLERLCSHYDLMITVDCGIQNAQEIKYCQYLGCDVILTDHHNPEQTIPQPYATIVPPQSLNTDFSGAGIAFKFAQALLSDNDKGKRFARSLLWLACLGTIVDRVEQRNENRTISVLGLQQLNDRTPACIRALALETEMKRPINKSQITWKLSPILNSASRLGFANVAAKILNLKESETKEIVSLSKQLGKINKDRKKIFDKFYNLVLDGEAYYYDENFMCVIFDTDSGTDSKGIQGILAARLSGMYDNKPTFVFTNIGEGLLVGSARCPDHNFTEILLNVNHLIISGGGHQNVGGLSMYAENFKEFSEVLNKAIPLIVENKTNVEKNIELLISDISMSLYNSLSILEPYEHGDSPLFEIKGIMTGEYQIIGKDDSHIKFQITDGKNPYTVLAWRQAEKILEDMKTSNMNEVTVQGRLKLNTWNNVSELQIEATSVDMKGN